MRTTTYKAPDKRQGYGADEIVAILSKHPGATVIVRPGWKGQPQQLIVNDPDPAERPAVLGTPRPEPRIECPVPPPGAHPEYVRTDPMRTTTELDGIMRATADEELVREELRAEGVDVAAVERAARRAQERGLGGAL